MDARLESLAVLCHPMGGITQCVAHLWEHLARFTRPVCITCANQTIEALALAHIAPMEPLLDPARPESIEAVQRYFRRHALTLANVQVGTWFTREIPYLTRLLSALETQGVRTVLTLHNVLPHEIFPVDLGELRELYRRGHGYVVGNEAQRRLLYERFDAAGRPVVIAPHGPFTLFERHLYDRTTARRFVGVPADARLVLFFGRLRRGKGLDCLVRALPALRARLPDAELFIQTDNIFHPELDSWLTEIASPGRGIHLRNEYVPCDLIEPIVKAADVVALPYSQVSQSGVLNLAKAFQRPVVVTDIFAGAAEINETYGRCVPVNDPQALARALGDLLSRSARERQEMGALALRLALEKESWSHHAAALEQVCRQVWAR